MGKGVPTGGGGSGGISSLFGGAKEFLTKGKDGVGLFGNISKGIGGLFTGPGADQAGSFGKLGDIFTGVGKDGVGSFGRMGDFFGGIGDAIGCNRLRRHGRTRLWWRSISNRRRRNRRRSYESVLQRTS